MALKILDVLGLLRKNYKNNIRNSDMISFSRSSTLCLSLLHGWRGESPHDHAGSWLGRRGDGCHRSLSRSRDGVRISAPPVRRPHSSYQRAVQGKCPLHFLNLNGAVCSNTLFSNTSALTSSLFILGKFYMQDSRTPRLLEHFWVPILGASCSNKLFVGTVRPSQPAQQGEIRVKFSFFLHRFWR